MTKMSTPEGRELAQVVPIAITFFLGMLFLAMNQIENKNQEASSNMAVYVESEDRFLAITWYDKGWPWTYASCVRFDYLPATDVQEGMRFASVPNRDSGPYFKSAGDVFSEPVQFYKYSAIMNFGIAAGIMLLTWMLTRAVVSRSPARAGR